MQQAVLDGFMRRKYETRSRERREACYVNGTEACKNTQKAEGSSGLRGAWFGE